MSYGNSPIRQMEKSSSLSHSQADKQAADALLANTLDFASIDELDPSLAEGYHLYYEREVPCELRSADGNDNPAEPGALEAIKVKVLLLGQQQDPDAVRVELSSESNLFFHYTSNNTPSSFKDIQEGQKLMVPFSEYSNVLMRMLNQCIREPHSHLAVFVMQPNGEARLDFIQNMEYKFIELLSCKFSASAEHVVRQHVSFRYNATKSRLALTQARLADIHALVKVKSPSLLLQLQRTPPRMPGTQTQTAPLAYNPFDAAISARRSPSIQRGSSMAQTLPPGGAQSWF